MSSNPYIHYYVNQAGSGIGGYQGVRFQKGQGWFGNVFKSAILPILKYFGKQALNTGSDVVKDAFAGENVLDALASRGKMAARNIASDAVDRLRTYAQTGKGRRKGRRLPLKSFKKRSRKRNSIKKIKGRGKRRTKRKDIPSIFS